MKRLTKKFIYLTLTLGLLLLTSCAKDVVDSLGDIHGIISDNAGAPIQAASVTITPTGKTTTTGSDGRYEFNGLDPQQYTVSVSKTNYADNTKSVTVTAGEVSKGDLILNQGQTQIKVNKTELSFQNADNLLAFEITNTGVGALEWQVKEEAEWISVEPSQGTTTKEVSTVSVHINRAGLSSSVEHTYTLNITSNGGAKEIKVRVLAKTSLVASPTRLDFGTELSDLVFTLANTAGTEAISCAIISPDAWLKINPANAEVTNKNTDIHVSVDRSQLPVGKKTGQIEIKSSQTGSIIIPVSIEVLEGKRLVASPTRLDFGTELSDLVFTLANTAGTEAISCAITSSDAWLKINPGNAEVTNKSTDIHVSVDRSRLPVGKKTGQIEIKSSQTGSIIILVSIEVLEGRLTASPTELDFLTNKTEDYLTIKKENGEGTIDYSLSANQPWISFAKTSGTVGAIGENVKVSVNRNGLPTGKHTGNITIQGKETNNVVIPVSLDVSAGESEGGGSCDKIISCDSKMKIEFTQCTKIGDTAEFLFKVTNTGDDVTLKFDSSIAYDDAGNAYDYRKNSLYLAGKRIELGYTTSVTFPKNVVLQGKMKLFSISSQAAYISRCDINISRSTPWSVLANKIVFENIKW